MENTKYKITNEDGTYVIRKDGKVFQLITTELGRIVKKELRYVIYTPINEPDFEEATPEAVAKSFLKFKKLI